MTDRQPPMPMWEMLALVVAIVLTTYVLTSLNSVMSPEPCPDASTSCETADPP